MRLEPTVPIPICDRKKNPKKKVEKSEIKIDYVTIFLVGALIVILIILSIMR